MRYNLNSKPYNINYVTTLRAGGSLLTYYSYEKDLSELEGRVPSSSPNLWLTPYSTLNKISRIKRIGKDTNNAVVCSLQIKKVGPDLEYYLEGEKLTEDLEVYFGQFRSLLKNSNLIQKYFVDYDVSLNSYLELDSHSEKVQLFSLTYGESANTFLQRNKLPAIESDFFLPPLNSIIRFYRGVNQITSADLKYQPLDNLDVFKMIDYVKVSNNCFSWREIKNGEMPEKTLLKDKNLLLEHKAVISLKDLTTWLTSDLNSNYEAFTKALKSKDKGLELNIVFHPPVFSSMQLEASPSIINPYQGKTSKIKDEVIVRVPRSIVKNAQKVIIIDFKFEDNIFTYNSVDNYTMFSIIDSKGQYKLGWLDFENSIFESLATYDFEDGSFRFLFKTPPEVLKQIELDRNYKINVKVSDLTSERR